MNIFKRLIFKLTNPKEYRTYMNTQAVNSKGSARVDGQCILAHPENIYIDDGSFINGGRIFASENAKIVIGKNCMISYDVHIRTDAHNYEKKNIPMKEQGMKEADIIIGDDVWIGYGAQVMSGVKMADGSVLGAGGVLTHDTEAYGVYAGVPARLIKYRE